MTEPAPQLTAEELLNDWRESIALCERTGRRGFVTTVTEWETYIATIDSLRTQLATAIETGDMWCQQAKQSEERETALREALQDLFDEQNGPPLEKCAESWQAAHDKAARALSGEQSVRGVPA